MRYALEARGQDGSEVRVISRRKGERVVLCVEDNGPGSPPHVPLRLFESSLSSKDSCRTHLGIKLQKLGWELPSLSAQAA